MGELNVLTAAIIIVAGILAGFINTLAGGGSFLTLAALDLAGLPKVMANGTNRVAVLVQNVSAVAGFRKGGMSDLKMSLMLSAPAVIGSVAGALSGVRLDAEVFDKLLVAAMFAMLVVLVLNPQRWLKNRQITLTPTRAVIAAVVMLAIGFYSGIIQAGVGFYIIAAIVLTTGLDLVKTNVLKVFIIGATTLVALLIFALNGQVDWIYGVLLAIGNGTGAWVGSHAAVKGGEKLVKIVLGIMLVVLIIRYLGIIPWFSA
ncbi:MAG: sulfite exporter TauE/SafE family protein [Anaerolineae bacterium]|jgi:uncharacterized membrane protein YfcA